MPPKTTPSTPSLFTAPQTVPAAVAIRETPHGLPVPETDHDRSRIVNGKTHDAPPPADPDAAPPADHPSSPSTGSAAPAPAGPEPPPAAQAGALPTRDPLPYYPRNADEMWRYAVMLARSSLVPKALHDKATDVFVVLMKGHDFGFKPMQSIAGIHVVEGKAEVGALAMVSLIRRSGLCQSWRLLVSDDRRAVYSTQRSGEEPIEFEYTIEEAEQMGLLDKGRDEAAKARNNWRLQPRTMLRRRCQSNLAREVYSDVVLGLYDHGELTEIQEIAQHVGLTEQQVADAVPATAVPSRAALPPATSGPIASMTSTASGPRVMIPAKSDPLKERLASRASVGGAVRRCSECDAPLDPRDADPCIACRPDPSA
jgi:hypothetical protein